MLLSEKVSIGSDREQHGHQEVGQLMLFHFPLLFIHTSMSAVTFPEDVPLQILAGPGSGKTRVLTSRIAYLVNHYGVDPNHLVAVTFTKKAAQEMRHRLFALLGKETTNDLVLGTFHATCARYLRKYGTRIGLNTNFVIMDAEDRCVPNTKVRVSDLT